MTSKKRPAGIDALMQNHMIGAQALDAVAHFQHEQEKLMFNALASINMTNLNVNMPRKQDLSPNPMTKGYGAVGANGYGHYGPMPGNVRPYPYHAGGAGQTTTDLMNNLVNSFGHSVADYHGMPLYGTHGTGLMYGGGPTPAGSNLFGQMGQFVHPAQYGQYNSEPGHIGQHWTPRSILHSDATMVTPSMVNSRRESVSSNDHDVPPTPIPYGAGSGQVAIFERSTPTMALTPSPVTNLLAFNMSTPAKQSPPAQLPLHLQLLLNRDPTIPRAIPAPSSPVKPLDRALENKNGETNVYIRGLHPETTDDMLQAYGARFGEIQSSKAIIDMKTNQCKGFGFIKYHNYEDAENCIRGFHHLGYECSFARESFYSKLKKFSDEQNTNLYVSNIPRNMNEHELSEIFAPHHVVSSRILRTGDGHGRGVGFARFESRDVCEEVIKNFNNITIKKAGGEDHTIQIRFSDTHEQKLLKQQTAAARQFRAAEFEYGVAQARLGNIPDVQVSRLTVPTSTHGTTEPDNCLVTPRITFSGETTPTTTSMSSSAVSSPGSNAGVLITIDAEDHKFLASDSSVTVKADE